MTTVVWFKRDLRSLQHTGWLNFRMRAMLMAVASYRCLTERQATAAMTVANRTGQNRLQAS